MKKLVLVALAVAATVPALAQWDRDGRRDRRDGGRVECTIYTRNKGSVYGSGQSCNEAISEARFRCVNRVDREAEKRCYNAGAQRNAMYSISCSNRREAYGACRHELPYSN